MTPLDPLTQDSPAAPDLPRLSKEVMVLTTLLQGVGLYTLLEGWWGLAGAQRLMAGSLLVAVPGFFVLCLHDVRDRLLWRALALVALVLLALHLSVHWMLDGPPASGTDWRGSSAWLPWLLCQGVLLFLALAWMQALLQRRSLRRVPYALLFGHAWNHALVLGFALQFVALGWAVLGLWAGLFALLKVRLFADTFTQPAFVCMATGLMAGLGLVLARGQPRPLRLMRHVLLALHRLLLPLLALVVVLFVLALPLTGVQPLWETRKATPLLMGVLLCLLVFVNAVYQDGSRAQPPYPAPLRALVAAALALMPVLATLALWAIALRVRQYGWTHERIWAAVAAGVLWLYALGYAWAALERQPAVWLQRLERINPAMSWLVMALLVLLHTPLLDPYRMGAASQYQRLATGVQPPTLPALLDLRFDHGRHGLPALQALQAVPALAQAGAAQLLAQALVVPSKPDGMRHHYAPSRPSAAELRRLIALAPGHVAPPEAWWQALAQYERGQHWLRSCRSPFAPDTAKAPEASDASDAPGQVGAAPPDAQTAACVLLQAQLDSLDAQPQQLLCAFRESAMPQCRALGWDGAGALRFLGTLSWNEPEGRWASLDAALRQQLTQRLRNGAISPRPARWQDVHLLPDGAAGEAAAVELPVGRLQPY